MLSALGFGDILALKKKDGYSISVNYFPWTPWAKDIDFVMFRAMMSGMISGFTGKKVELRSIKSELVQNSFNLKISE